MGRIRLDYYNAYVRAEDGTEMTIAIGFSFRTEQNSVSALDNLTSYASMGTQTVGDASIEETITVTASNYQVPNAPQNTLDNYILTRWSAEGDGEWIEFDLGKIKSVRSVSIAFLFGCFRTATFDVELSVDGSPYINALTAATSSGKSIKLEHFDLSDGFWFRLRCLL